MSSVRQSVRQNKTLLFVMALGLSFIVTIVSAIFYAPSAEAKRFRNAYVSFDLPDDWNCNMEGTEWVCVNQEQKPKEAVIILTAKEVGPSDSIENYRQHLEATRNLKGPQGPQASQVVHVRDRVISNHTWVDGLQLGSEMSSYYTRYLGTTKDRIAILVTFSAHRNFYTRYSQDFLRAIESLRVVATQDMLSNPRGGVRGAGETIGAPIGQVMPGDLYTEDYMEEGTGGGSSLTTWLALAILALAIGLLLLKKALNDEKKIKGKKNPSPHKKPRPKGK